MKHSIEQNRRGQANKPVAKAPPARAISKQPIAGVGKPTAVAKIRKADKPFAHLRDNAALLQRWQALQPEHQSPRVSVSEDDEVPNVTPAEIIAAAGKARGRTGAAAGPSGTAKAIIDAGKRRRGEF
jgi:hypothetical protein